MQWMKKVLSVMLVFAFVIGLNVTDLSVAQAADPVNVKLYQGKLTYASYGYKSFNGTIEVENLAYNKKVSVYYNTGGTTWYTANASYVSPTEANRELWTFNVATHNNTSDNSQIKGDVTIRFAVKYEVNGQTYWDNNGGNDYYLGKNYGDLVLGKPAILHANANLYSNGVFTGTLNLKNLAYAKDVKVVYTTDNWQTTKSVNAQFQSQFGGNNLEQWYYSVVVGTGVTQVKFALSYTVNGVTYWDNNFSKNYSVQ